MKVRDLLSTTEVAFEVLYIYFDAIDWKKEPELKYYDKSNLVKDGILDMDVLSWDVFDLDEIVLAIRV